MEKKLRVTMTFYKFLFIYIFRLTFSKFYEFSSCTRTIIFFVFVDSIFTHYFSPLFYKIGTSWLSLIPTAKKKLVVGYFFAIGYYWEWIVNYFVRIGLNIVLLSFGYLHSLWWWLPWYCWIWGFSPSISWVCSPI